MSVEIKLPKLYQWQKDVANTPKRHRCIVVSRRAGKTLTARHIAIKALLAGQKVLWCSPIHQQTKEQFNEIYQTVEQLVVSSEKSKEITLITGGKLWTRSADNPASLRSLGYDLVILDEFAFMSEDAWSTIRPTLSDHGTGRALIISTPNGHNHLHTMFTKHADDPEWYTYQSDWTCSPHLKQEEIEKAQRELTPNEFRQEYQAEFMSPKGALFDSSWLTNIMIDKMPDTYQRTMIGTDYSLGHSIRSDWQAIAFCGWYNDCLYCDCSADRLNIEAFNQKIKLKYEQYLPEGIACETNCFQELACHNLIKLWAPGPVPPIYEIDNKVNKEVRISRLATLLSRNQLKILNNSGGIECFHELSDFPSAGTHDDVLDAIEMAYRTMIHS